MSDANKPGHHDSPLVALWVSMTGASADDHHEIPPGVDVKSTKVGHEPDKFDVKGIIYVPIAVTLVLIVTYVIVQASITYLLGQSSDSISGRTDINSRFARFGTTDATPIVDEQGVGPLPVVNQPRLEYLRQVDASRPGVAADPEYLRSYLPKEKGNSPQIYPEDLRPNRYVDPLTLKQPLIEHEWVKTNEVAQIPIAEAMKALIDGKKLPSKKDGHAPDHANHLKPKLSNGGAVKSNLAKPHDHDHDHDPKPEVPKKVEPKK
jgi:hypothetical protein